MIVASLYSPRIEKWAGVDYDALLPLVAASCHRLGLRHVCVSDEPRPGVETVIVPLRQDPDELMTMLLEGKQRFLEITPGPALLIGADCLVTRDIRPHEGFDIAITIGEHFSDCEMNTGAIWVADGKTCAPIWARAVARHPVAWGADQVTLYEEIKASGLRINRIPATEHNDAPRSPSDPAGMPTVVHFRGRRKLWMHEWARRHLGLAAA